MQINNTYGRYLILSAYCSWLIMFPMRSFGASLELTFSDAKQLAIPQVIVALIPKLKKDYSSQRVAVMDQKNNQFIPSLLVAVSSNKCNLITQRVNLLAAPKTTHWEA